jgi:hypothetical protein
VRAVLLLSIAVIACASRHRAAHADAGPSDDDCAKAMANLQRVMPGETADADEASYCRKMPRAVVECLQTVRSKSEADACVRRAASGAAPSFRPAGSGESVETIGKASAASADDCRRALAHVKEIVPGFTGEADLLTACIKTATTDDVACLLAAASAGDVRRCGLGDP